MIITDGLNTGVQAQAPLCDATQIEMDQVGALATPAASAGMHRHLPASMRLAPTQTADSHPGRGTTPG